MAEESDAFSGFATVVEESDAFSGFAIVVKDSHETSSYGKPSFHQRTSRTNHVDKHTGRYARSTTKEVVSTGQTFKERGSGRVGSKNEYQTTSTYKVGDKRGYSEYQVVERYRRVNFEDSGKNSRGSNKKYVN